ncbi:MAG TPA: hypothetical protein VKK79_07430 [Candidatus Lokiarchaeia archaeon]|nr:hypothetical protein [Candidatus Lokiarchaeia archaeon]
MQVLQVLKPKTAIREKWCLVTHFRRKSKNDCFADILASFHASRADFSRPSLLAVRSSFDPSFVVVRSGSAGERAVTRALTTYSYAIDSFRCCQSMRWRGIRARSRAGPACFGLCNTLHFAAPEHTGTRS